GFSRDWSSDVCSSDLRACSWRGAGRPAVVVDEERRVLVDPDPVQRHAVRQGPFDPRPEVRGEVLGRRDLPAGCERIDGVVQVLVVEGLDDDLVEDSIEHGKIHGEAGDRIDSTADRGFEDIVVAVAVRVAASPENAAVLLVAPLRAVVSVGGGEAYAAGQVGDVHVWKVGDP